jgi:predicted component of type VI protein secretion system
MEVHGTKEPLVELPQVQPPYIVLESFGKASKTQRQNRSLQHVVSLADNKQLKLGRGHECDIRLEEVSMSRWHASIRYCDGKFEVEDNKSKFGTLVSLNKPCSLESGSTISVKVGRTVLALSLPSTEMPSASEGSLSTCMAQHQSLEVHDVDTDDSGQHSCF